MSGKRRLDEDEPEYGTPKARRFSTAFDLLPTEIAKWILSFLTETKDVLSARSVCKQWDLIVMDPRPVIVSVHSPRKFARLVQALAVYNEDVVPFRVSERGLFTEASSTYPREHVQLQFSTSTTGFKEEMDLLLPAAGLGNFFYYLPDEFLKMQVIVAIFGRIGKVALVSLEDQKRYVADLVMGRKEVARATDFDYRIVLPFDAYTLTSMRGTYSDIITMTVRTAPMPECIKHGTNLGDRLAVLTIVTGGANPQLNYFFAEPEKSESMKDEGRALSVIDSALIDEYAETKFEPLLEIKSGWAALRRVCRHLRQFGNLKLCIPVGENAPIVLECDKEPCKMRWVIGPFPQ